MCFELRMLDTEGRTPVSVLVIKDAKFYYFLRNCCYKTPNSIKMMDKQSAFGGSLYGTYGAGDPSLNVPGTLQTKYTWE